MPENNKWYRIQRNGENIIVKTTSSPYVYDDACYVVATAYHHDGSMSTDFPLYTDKYNWVELTDKERVAFILAN